MVGNTMKGRSVKILLAVGDKLEWIVMKWATHLLRVVVRHTSPSNRP